MYCYTIDETTDAYIRTLAGSGPFLAQILFLFYYPPYSLYAYHPYTLISIILINPIPSLEYFLQAHCTGAVRFEAGLSPFKVLEGGPLYLLDEPGLFWSCIVHYTSTLA